MPHSTRLRAAARIAIVASQHAAGLLATKSPARTSEEPASGNSRSCDWLRNAAASLSAKAAFLPRTLHETLVSGKEDWT